MLKFALVTGILVGLMSGIVSANEVFTDLVDGTSNYFMSEVGLSWYDHYHQNDHQKMFGINAPVLAFRGYDADLFASFDGPEVKEFGASLRLEGLLRYPLFRKVLITPYVFKNYEADAIGTGIQATIRLR